MSSTIRLDGKALSVSLQQGLVERIAKVSDKLGRVPGLGVLLVGDDAASQVYVRNKLRIAEKVGAHAELIRMPANSTTEALVDAVQTLNQNPSIDAFLVQLPLPPHVEAHRVLESIDPSKDADGLHTQNIGKLVSGLEGPRPCTPSGVMALLGHHDISVASKHAVVIGRSTIVGKPMAMMLLQKNATVTLCHSRTVDLEAHCQRADLVVAAVGRPNMLDRRHIKAGACVVDVGINRVEGRLVGDVNFEALDGYAGALTPVPGGVGPMTVHFVVENAVRCAERKISTSSGS